LAAFVYLTLLIALLPLSWAVWKTKDLRVGIYTHCALNLIVHLASFGLALNKMKEIAEHFNIYVSHAVEIAAAIIIAFAL
jgi:hypothetical protein